MRRDRHGYGLTHGVSKRGYAGSGTGSIFPYCSITSTLTMVLRVFMGISPSGDQSKVSTIIFLSISFVANFKANIY